MLRSAPKPIPAIQFLSPVEGHLREKFFPGTGFYVELFASFLVLTALVNSQARCSVMVLWKPQKCFLRGPEVLSRHCLFPTLLVSSMLLPLHRSHLERLPCPQTNAGVKHLWFVTLHSLGPVGMSPRVTPRYRVW